MIISHKYRFIFIKTNKTAGTSIETYLSHLCGEGDILTPFGKEEPEHFARNYKGCFNIVGELASFPKREWKRSISDFVYRKKFYNHISASKVKYRIAKGIWDDYYKFCVERNPWDKAISHYYFMTRRKNMNLTLGEYLDAGFRRINYPKYTDLHNADKIIVDRVIRYENLNSELSEVFGQLGVPFSGCLNVRAKANFREDRRPYQEVLTASQREKIQKLYAKEIALFGYAF